MLRRICALWLCLCLIFTLLPMAVTAAEAGHTAAMDVDAWVEAFEAGWDADVPFRFTTLPGISTPYGQELIQGVYDEALDLVITEIYEEATIYIDITLDGQAVAPEEARIYGGLVALTVLCALDASFPGGMAHDTVMSDAVIALFRRWTGTVGEGVRDIDDETGWADTLLSVTLDAATLTQRFTIAYPYETEALSSDAPEATVAAATPTAAPTKAAAQQSGYMRVSAQQYALLNAFPAYGAATIGVFNRDDVVYVQGQEYDSAGNVWAQTVTLDTNPAFGYTIASDLTPMSVSEVNAYFNNIPQATPTAAATYSPTAFSGYAVLMMNDVNFRASASTTGSVIARLSVNTLVRVLAQTTADGYTWYQCESGGRTGYLRADMLTLLSVQEYQQVIASPSYNQNGNIITPTATANISSSITWATPKPGDTTSDITFVTLPPQSASAKASPSPSTSPEATPEFAPMDALDVDQWIGAFESVWIEPSFRFTKNPGATTSHGQELLQGVYDDALTLVITQIYAEQTLYIDLKLQMSLLAEDEMERYWALVGSALICLTYASFPDMTEDDLDQVAAILTGLFDAWANDTRPFEDPAYYEARWEDVLFIFEFEDVTDAILFTVKYPY